MVSNLLKAPFTGKKQPKLGELDPDTKQPLSPYLASQKLVEIVNLAIYLERPLLLKGEPGCGKTQLAWALKYELGLPLEEWVVKSTSRAKDGLYTYDAVGRLRDAQLTFDAEAVKRSKNPLHYTRLGPLGRAFVRDTKTIVLIDEIDKADIDFPNDLLLELDKQRFFVEETGQVVQAVHKPIVLITSNDEKDLPDAFLRRCLFHYIEFPDRDRLIEIILSIHPDVESAVAYRAVMRFEELRDQMHQEAGKNVSTSELLDWIAILKKYPADDVLTQLDGELPFLGVLLKNWEQHKKYLRQLQQSA